MMVDPLVELLRAPDCQPLLDRLRQKLQRGETLSGRCRLSRLTQAQRQQISAVTGRTSRGAAITIDLESFSQIVINTGRFSSLQELVEQAHGGPIENRTARKLDHAAAWECVWNSAHELVDQFARRPADLPAGHQSQPGRLICLEPDECFHALSSMRQTGWLKRVVHGDADAAQELIRQSFSLLQLLPTEPTPLAVFAAEHTGDAHALDNHQALSRLLLKLLSSGRTSDPELLEKRAGRRRRLWESVGIVLDELSSGALVLNLPATGDSFSDIMLQRHQLIGMPCRLTFRHLRLTPPVFSIALDADQPADVYVCENPSVIAAAAERLGSRCPPLICVEGHPTLTCWSLLRQLVEAGYRLKYHGDFDWGGIRIANQIYESLGFEPWRFTAADHRLTSIAHRKLRAPVSQASWDPELTSKILAAGVAVEEESVIEELLSDLLAV